MVQCKFPLIPYTFLNGLLLQLTGCIFSPKALVLGNVVKFCLPIAVALWKMLVSTSMAARTLLGLVVRTLTRETPPRFLSHKHQCGVTCKTKLEEPNTGIENTCKPLRLGNLGSKEESDFRTVLWEAVSVPV